MAAGSGTLRVYRGSHNSWTETTLSPDDAPVEDGELGTFTGTISSDQLVSVEINSLITGDGTYSVIITQDPGGSDVAFGSRESAAKPELIVETADAPAFTLTVVNGTGDGDYPAGESVNITADAPPAGQVFDRWTGDLEGILDVDDPSTTLSMPAAHATLIATYRDLLYTLTVVNGTGGGNYPAGESVIITADAPPVGQVFDRWTGDLEGILDVDDPSTSLSMPAANATLIATYKDLLYTLTVVNGTGSGNYPAGESVNITADDPPAGQVFDRWTGDLEGILDVDDPSTTLSMPAANATLIATYKDLLYTLTVINGTGSGNYPAGESVNITAGAPPAGQVFDRWTGDLEGILDVDDPSTTLSMPAANATLIATYKDLLYTLTVINGTGSGNYPADASVNITADDPPAGQVFDRWTGDLDGVVDAYSPSTSITMPAVNATLTATYKDQLYTLTVVHGTGDGDYPAGAPVDITADTPPTGQVFDRWTGDLDGVVDAYSPWTSITMPAVNATLTATYKEQRFTLTVHSGDGDGDYPATTVVNIVANAPPADQQFDQWTGDVAMVADVNAASTSVTMPAANATVTATYKPKEYTLTVHSGSGDGSYPAGASVNIIANAPLAGQQFDKWTGDVAIVADVNAASTSVTMPAANATVTATYKPKEYTLTVHSGSGDGSYPAGTSVNIIANAPLAGQQFDKWTGDVAIVADVNAASTSVTMPAANATVTATYKPREYILTVNSGSGDGNYPAGTSVNIVATTAPAGQQFDQWTGDVAIVADVNAASTSVTMPAANATVTATYKPREYILTVNSGSGDGNYPAGTSVNIVATTAPAGQQFDQWTGDVAMVANVNAASTSITMPAANATVTATYKPREYTLTVNSGSGDGNYPAGTVVNIVAATAPAGQQFDKWTGDVAMVANVNAASTSITMPAANATVTATYKPREYILTVNSGSGDGNYPAGTSVNIVATTAPAGQQFDQWTGDVAIVSDVNAASTSITMPAANATVTATYKPREYILTVNSGSGDGNYPAGTVVNLVANAAPAGQQFDKWTGDVAMVANVNAASTSITMPAANATVTATYKPREYTLTVNSGTGDGNYPAGTVVNLVAATAPAGQQFDEWTGDVAMVANVNAASTSITMPAANATVTATYKPREYTLTVNSGSPDGNYPAGTVVNIVAATAPAGQQFDKWTGDVAIVADVNAASTSITMPAANATVTATYKPREYTLTVNSGSGDGNYPAGTVVNLVADAAPAGQQFDKWTGDVAMVANVNAASTSITMPAANATVTATYKPREYTLTVSSGSGDGNYPAGTSVNIVATTAPAGQQFDQWTGDVAIVANVNAASTSVTMPAANATVTATYKPREYTLTVTSGSGDGNYPAGTSVNIVASTASAGQQFDQWTGDVAIVANVNAASTSITMPAANATVTATYKPREYTLTVNSGSGDGNYPAGTLVNLVANTAPVGQQFDKWTGDVANIANVNAASTSITMPAANATVTATYKPREYTLTVNSGTGDGNYPAGTLVNLVANTAPVGQQFDKWTGDVANIANVNAASTSVTMPSANATVTATYKAITPLQYTLTVNNGTGSGSYLAATIVNLVAAAPTAGLQFDRWTGDVANVANVNAASTSIVMPAANATVTATYKPKEYILTVNSGTGDGNYPADTSVNIVANTPPAGQQFDQWTGDVAMVANVNAASTSVTMPAANATVTATYKAVTPVQYTLTVNGGSGSGSYAAGASVNLVANAAPAGQQFDQWTGDVANVANVNAASTSVTMPAANATVTATYLPSQGGIGTIGPVSGLTATANAGMITSINGIPVSDLLLGTTSFPTPPAQTAYPPRNADNFDLSLLCAGDGQPYIDLVFASPS